jgi:hypothetical protein
VRPLEVETALRDLIVSRGASLNETHAVSWGPGPDAEVAWQAFKQVAAIPAHDPFVDSDGVTCRVSRHEGNDLLLFESEMIRRSPELEFVQPWISDQPESEMLALSFSRQFSFEDDDHGYRGMNRLRLTVEVVAGGDVRGLADEQMWGRGGPASGATPPGQHPEISSWFGDCEQWSAEVERSAAFRSAFADHRPDRFYFGQSDI